MSPSHQPRKHGDKPNYEVASLVLNINRVGEAMLPCFNDEILRLNLGSLVEFKYAFSFPPSQR